ncbi:hypothetical protein R5R35_011816 [Gryllus longicercus]|uniref:FAS1 domain-containing protein n=1 Tax=Gryllus longicercus TaxID=2509291 RepID=A0AAN9WSF6_9ORTH
MDRRVRTQPRSRSASLMPSPPPSWALLVATGLAVAASVAPAAWAAQGSTPAAHKIPRWNMKIAQEQGPNACVVEEAGGRRFYSDCKYWRQRDICGQTAVPRYECCEGFEQLPGEPGCAGAMPLTGVLETARRLGAARFVRLLERSGLHRGLTASNAVTLFAPLDSAFDELPRERLSRLEQVEDPTTRPLLQYHLTDGRVLTSGLPSDHLQDTRLAGRQLRLNKYSSGVQTANCARLVRRDVPASDGVVHLLENVLDPAFASAPAPLDLAQLVATDGRFSALARTIERADFAGRLRSPERPCTLLAPSDEAFQKLSAARLQRILDDEGARRALLEHHVIPHPLCLPAVLGEHRVRALDGQRLSFDCDARGATVEGRRLRAEPVLASNGALYMLDDVLLPDRAKSVLQLLDERGLTTFASLVRSAGLDDAFDSFHDYTVFAPSEAAMFELPETRLRTLRSNREAARGFVMLHATAGRVAWASVAAGQAVMSLDERHRLRLQVYRRGPGVEAALVEERDVEGLNGCVHVIDRVLEPAELSTRDLLRRDGNFSIFLSALERGGADVVWLPGEDAGAGLDAGVGVGVAAEEEQSLTLFAPTDAAFERLGEQRLTRLMEDPQFLKKTLRHHVCEGMVSSAAWTPELRHGVRTRQGDVHITRAASGKIKVDEATVLRSDLVTTNGVIHVINRVLLPES